MQVEAIPMLINSDFLNAPLDVKLHLADYKMHGKKSYVFQIKDLLHGIYECTYISLNDQDINGEALEYLIKNNKHIGEALIAVFDLERKDTFKTLTAMTAVANSTTAMTAVLNSTTAMTAVANSTTAMTAVANSTTAMTAVLNNTIAIDKIVNSKLIKEISYSNNTWGNGENKIIKGIIVSFSNSSSDNALTILSIDDAMVTSNYNTRNACDGVANTWKVWLGRISKEPKYNVAKKYIKISNYYACAMRYLPID